MATRTITTSSSLEDRIASLEKSSWGTTITATKNGSSPDTTATNNNNNNNNNNNTPVITPELRRARRHVEQSKCYSSVWKHCPSDYYTFTLDQRRVFLGAHSTSQLCKACLFENKNYKPNINNTNNNTNNNNNNDPTNSKYYLIVVQYTQAINTKKLSSELRGLRPPGPTRLESNYFSELRLAPERVSERLTGYGHNGVSPFGLLAMEDGGSNSMIAVVVCKSIVTTEDGGNDGSEDGGVVAPRFVWMGGGDRDWKLGMATSEFVRGVDGIVLDVSEPRA